jgi:mannose-6-phosphate isomerase-like protein (cupin superfamily)
MKKTQLTFKRAWQVYNGTTRSQAAVMVIPPKESEGEANNKHDGDQWLFVIKGRGRAEVERKTVTLSAGSLLMIEKGERHQIRNEGSAPLVTLNFYAPPQY